MKISSIFMKVILFLIIPSTLFSWHNDPKINTLISKSSINQFDHHTVASGDGGTFITWAEKLDEVDYNIYAQKINSHGDAVWKTKLDICTAPDFQGLPKICSDGVGGAIITWHDSRKGMNPEFSNVEIYAQRIDKLGNCLWDVNGIIVCDALSWQCYPEIASDGMGGALIVWDDGRSGDSQVHCQRIDQNGKSLWIDDGVLVAEVTTGQSNPLVISDGAGGAIVSWSDFRQLGNVDIYVQRIDVTGKIIWGKEGFPLANVDGEQFGARITTDGAGGCIVSWTDGRKGDHDFDIYAQRVNHKGQIQWPLQGLPITEASGNQIGSALTADGFGGAIIAWEDGRKGVNDTDIYAQRVTADAVFIWEKNGTPVAYGDTVQVRPHLVSDGLGGAVITFQDFYRGGTWWNIYAQRIDSNGKERWLTDGVPVSTADGTQSDPWIISTGSEGFVITWFDGRNSECYNIYSQQVDINGLLGGGEFKLYTTNQEGNPAIKFKTNEMIRFFSTWSAPAPKTPGTYQAESIMYINNNKESRQDTITYDVTSDVTSDPIH